MTQGHRMRSLVVPLALVAALSGCGGGGDQPGVASAGKPGGASSAPAAPREDAAALALKFARCMRAEGIDVPDPSANGKVMISEPLSVAGSPGDKKMAAAMEKCRGYLPTDEELAKPTPQDIAALRDQAQCMRDNGVAGYPDPDPATGASKLSDPAIVTTAKFRKAAEKCQAAVPALPAGAGE